MDGLGEIAPSDSQVAKAVGQIFQPLRTASLDEVLQKWASGQTLKEIGEEIGVNRSAISEWVVRHADKSTREWARELHYETRLDQGLEELETAADNPDLARTREAVLKRIEWRASREVQARWGDKPNTAIQVNAGEGGVQLVVYGGSETVAGAQHNGQSAVQQMASAQDLTSDSQ